jgi:hypothetical protein
MDTLCRLSSSSLQLIPFRSHHITQCCPCCTSSAYAHTEGRVLQPCARREASLPSCIYSFDRFSHTLHASGNTCELHGVRVSSGPACLATRMSCPNVSRTGEPFQCTTSCLALPGRIFGQAAEQVRFDRVREPIDRLILSVLVLYKVSEWETIQLDPRDGVVWDHILAENAGESPFEAYSSTPLSTLRLIRMYCWLSLAL